MPSARKSAPDRDAVRDFLRRTLEATPNLGSRDLQERAGRLDRAVGKLPIRVFHGRYVLPVVRAMKKGTRPARAAVRSAADGAPKRRGRPPRSATVAAAPPSTADGSPAVRAILLEFAQAIAGADVKTVVATIGQVDQYADRIAAAAKR